MKRKIMVVVLLFVGICLQCLVTNDAAISQEYKMRIGHVFDAKHAHQIALTQFAEMVDKDTNGRVEIQVIPSSGLGSHEDLAEQLKMGAVEMMCYYPGSMSVPSIRNLCSTKYPTFGKTSIRRWQDSREGSGKSTRGKYSIR